MNMLNVFNVSGSSLRAESVRLNTVASNMANANVVSTTPEGVYKARFPIFQTVLNAERGEGVRVAGIVESQAEARQEYSPDHPLANDDGYVFHSNVNLVEQMADMISASRNYQNNVEVMNTTKDLILQTLQLGR